MCMSALGVSLASAEEACVHPGACRISVTELVGDESGELPEHVGCQVAVKERALRYARGSLGRSESVNQLDDVVGILRFVASHDRVCLEAKPGRDAGHRELIPEHPAAGRNAAFHHYGVTWDEMAVADRERGDFTGWPDVCLGWRAGRRLLRAAGPVAHRAQKLHLQPGAAILANPAPFDLAPALRVRPQAQQPQAVDDRLVVVSRLPVKEVEREMKVQVCGPDMRAYAPRRASHEKAWHGTADDG